MKSFQLIVDREPGNSSYGFSCTKIRRDGRRVPGFGMKMGEDSDGAPRDAAEKSSGGGGWRGGGHKEAVVGGADWRRASEGTGRWRAGRIRSRPGDYVRPGTAHLSGAAAPAPGGGVATSTPGLPPPPASNPPSTVVSLTEMLDVEELKDDVEYGEIMEDMKEECGKFGTVLSVVIPRPGPAGSDEQVPGLGKVFVQYSDVAGATAARNALHGGNSADRSSS